MMRSCEIVLLQPLEEVCTCGVAVGTLAAGADFLHPFPSERKKIFCNA